LDYTVSSLDGRLPNMPRLYRASAIWVYLAAKTQ
jgi:hypothetical protein